ncbi:MAG: M14 family metallopeptidase, partial [Phycisphaerales bacterium JB043]
STPEEARASGKTIVFAFGNIHAGEVCGKEALTMIARQMALHPDRRSSRAILDECVVLLAPIYNADGNERFDPGNRPGQDGPETMGQRPNAMGLDLNRDYVKLESPEARAMVGLFKEWDPHVVIDTHTTNGSSHEFTLTYEVALNPSAHNAPIEYVRETLFPDVTHRVKRRTGYDMFFYGNFDREKTGWYTYDPRPRFGGSYIGFRNRLSILTEAHSYAPFEDRVLCTRALVEEIFAHVARNATEIRAMCALADAETAASRDPVGLRHAIAPKAGGSTVIIPGYVEETDENGRRRKTERKRAYEVTHYDRFEPTLSVERAAGYLVPQELEGVIELLELHGIEYDRADVGLEVEVERETVTSINRAQREFQGHRNVQVETRVERDTMRVDEGFWFVPTTQAMGSFVSYLLEARSADGVVAWNFVDEWLSEGGEYPIVRVVEERVR